MNIKYFLVLFFVFFLVGCTMSSAEKISVDTTTKESEFNENNNQRIPTTEDIVNNGTIFQENLISDRLLDTEIISENFLKYIITHGENDSLLISINGEVFYDTTSYLFSDRVGRLEGYFNRGNLLRVEFLDISERVPITLTLELNGEEEIFSWRGFNRTGSFELPIDFVLE